MKSKYIIFDLDDTLVQEIDFLKSAYANIAHIVEGNDPKNLYHEMIGLYEQNENVFQEVVNRYPKFSVNGLLQLYRQHYPNLQFNCGAKELLKYCKNKNFKLGLVSDGYSITQRNKLKALGIEDWFDKVIISEEFGSTKPNLENFEIFIEDNEEEYYYIANDTQKDFLAPNKLNWTSICLIDKGDNIHSQNFHLEKQFMPQYCVHNLCDIKKLI